MNTMKELPEELANKLTNLPSLFCRLLYSNEDTEKVAATLRDSMENLHLVEREIKKIYDAYPKLEGAFFNYLSDEISKIKSQIYDNSLLFLEERENILNSLSRTISKVFNRSINVFQDSPAKEMITSQALTILFNELVGAFEPYSQDYLNYAFNGGAKPKGYSDLRRTNKFKDTQWIYLISELCTNGVTDWSAADAFGIKNPAQKKNNYANNKKGKPKGYEKIDAIINKIKKVDDN